MNLLLVEWHEVEARLEAAEGRVQGQVLLSDRRAEHLRKILKVVVGQDLRVGLIGGGVGQGTVLAIGPRRDSKSRDSGSLAPSDSGSPAPGEVGDRVPDSGSLAPGEILLGVDIEATTPERSGTDLILAVPRPQVLHRILQYAAAMSVGRIFLVNSWRVEKSFFASPSMQPEKIGYHLRLGAEQGMVTSLPEVRIERLLVPFLEGYGQSEEAPRQRLIAHPEASCMLEDAVGGGPKTHRVVAIGPEGGWLPREIQTFSSLGFVPVNLGPWILRVEMALVSVLSQLELCDRR